MAIELSELQADLKTGDVAGGNFTTTEPNGTQQANGEATVFDDQRFPAVGAGLFSASGRIETNYAEITVDFANNARFNDEFIAISAQMSHARKDDSDIFPHIHWVQNQNVIPNILVEYRWYNNNELIPSVWEKVVVNSVEFLYASGNLMQISKIPLPASLGTGKRISSWFEVRTYRDSANASGLFSGADAYSGAWSLKEFDIHIEKDMNGSREEFTK